MPETTIDDTHARRTLDQILDIREDFETAEGMIPEARHIPMGELNARLDEVDRTRRVVVVCRSGNRSARVADALNAAGYTTDTMTGGMIAWQAAGLPTR
ncbi:rhodanese-like domain-containing protein [Arthrobacter crystallopoietes]|uniref:Rhodanese-related sulfurtransferase n=1 Tax=Crystallibacter crystallopoietes TaxID=37928 RepID=A0A1H1DNI8_9MICC|nr:rhodanese-like domain-containing protein [Arthrobacter crystallopoietes]AUI50232.1 sulfurtransferase [Arthrobacter crystallopoietes]SDQ78042.1 Rhodanese-related sulfurtransferase [Arthrobacter crystallopoietes]